MAGRFSCIRRKSLKNPVLFIGQLESWEERALERAQSPFILYYGSKDNLGYRDHHTIEWIQGQPGLQRLSYYTVDSRTTWATPFFSIMLGSTCSPIPKPIFQHDLEFILGRAEQNRHYKELAHGKSVSVCVQYFHICIMFTNLVHPPKLFVPLFYMRQRKH